MQNRLRCAVTDTVPEPQRVMGSIQEMVRKNSTETNLPSAIGFAMHPHLCGLGTEQVRKLYTALSINPQGERDPCEGYRFYCLLMKQNCFLSCIIDGSYLQMMATSRQRKVSETSFKSKTAPNIVKVLLLFHALRLVETKYQMNQLFLPVSYKTVCALRLLQRCFCEAWKTLLHFENLDTVRTCVLSSLLYVYSEAQFCVLSGRDEELAPTSQLEQYAATEEPVMSTNATADDVWNREPLLRSAFCSCAGFLLNYLHGTMTSGDLYATPEKEILSWPRL